MCGPELRKPEETNRPSVTVESRGLGITRVSILGEIDMSRFEELDGVLASASEGPPAVLEIDLSEVTFMDSQGLRLLLRAQERVKANGALFLVLNPPPRIRRLFEISGVGGLIDVADDPEYAEICPCCKGSLTTSDPAEDGLRPQDRWCSECRWVVLQEVRAGGQWPVICPTHGRTISKSPVQADC